MKVSKDIVTVAFLRYLLPVYGCLLWRTGCGDWPYW